MGKWPATAWGLCLGCRHHCGGSQRPGARYGGWCVRASGPSSCAPWPAASSWWSDHKGLKADPRPWRHSAAASTSCAICRQARPSSPPSSPSPKRMLTAHSGARSSSGPRCRSWPLSWTRHDVLAYMTFPAAHHLHSTNPMPQWRDQAADQHHLPQRRSHHTADRRHPARAKRRMGRSESQIHDTGINRSHERQYNRRAA